jgi:putative ABC transport system permease protein
MIRVAFRNLFQHKLRTALTILAVLLGVAMISGTYVLTDQLRSGFEDIYKTAYKNIDVIVMPKPAFGEAFEAADQTLPASLVDKVRKVEGVQIADGGLQAVGVVVVDGEPVQTGGAPTFVFSNTPRELDSVIYYEGSDPRESGTVAVNRALSEKTGVKVGDTIGLGTKQGLQEVEISGLLDFGSEGSSLGGAIMVVAYPEDMRQWYGFGDRVSYIQIKAEGVKPAALVQRIKTVIDDPKVMVQTGQASAVEQTKAVGDALDSVLTPALLAFGGVALLVGAFIIFNTFSITVAQRQREFALMRTLGASRRQVLTSVFTEAVLIGVGASVAGLFAGLGVAKGINQLFKAIGADIPVGGIELAPRTIIVALAVGILVTLISALVPALRATRVPPVAALQEGATLPPSRLTKFTPLFGALFALTGIALLVAGFVTDGTVTQRLLLMAVGGVLVFFAVATVARYIVRPVAKLLGAPLGRADRSSGRLARENSMRNPARTASTAAALMIGIAVVVFVAVFTAGFKSSFVDAIDEAAKGDLIVRAQNRAATPISGGAVEAIRRVPWVGAVSGVATQQVRIDGANGVLIGVEPSDLQKLWDFTWLEGGSKELLDELGGDKTVVEEQFALSRSLQVGDSFTVTTRSGEEATFEVIGIYRDPNVFSGAMVSYAAWDALFPNRDAFYALVKGVPGASTAQLQKSVKAAMEEYPGALVETKQEFVDSISKQLNQFLYMLYALLAVSVIISLFGIVNTLILTVYERTREIGMLRAIGSSRSQIRRMIRYESVITAIMGGVLGILVGVAFAYIVTTQLGAQGISFTLPVAQLLVCLAVAIVVGVLAAVLPARRAARTDILAAIHYE